MARATTKKDAQPTMRFDDGVPVGRIFLALNNPRHEPVQTETEAIEWLCEREDVYPMARDIVRHGLSPLERFALTAIGSGKPTATTSYYVEEGNRRICALKLLSDPDLAPAKLRKSFERLAESWTPIRTVPAVVFSSQDELRVWLDRVHSGPQDGIGRRTWNAEQKQRFYGSSKNALAQSILDYAENEGMLTKEERQGKLTTAQRFLNNDVLQETLGIDRSNPDDLGRTRPKSEFDTLLKRFIRDLVKGDDVTSRMNKPDVVQYARSISTTPNVTTTRIETEPLARAPTGAVKKPTRTQPRKPEKAKHLRYDDDVALALRGLGNEKLESLYYSICSVELERHTPLICIGAWAFFETLTAVQGRNGDTSFDSFLSKAKLAAIGVPGDTRAVRSALGRVSEYGNQTKHHAVSATFNGDQLNNDMISLQPVVLRCINDALPTK